MIDKETIQEMRACALEAKEEYTSMMSGHLISSEACQIVQLAQCVLDLIEECEEK